MIELQQVTRRYRTKRGLVNALDNADLSVNEGEFVCVRGKSGSGKTTLLLVVGGMLRPSTGAVRINGQDLYALGEAQRNRFRASNIGFVFQMFHLVPYLTVLENVILPPHASNSIDARERAASLLEQFGMAHRADHRPAELSAGERQRAAIARAMLNNPKIILADEPTGNLDPENARQVGAILRAFQQQGGTVVVVTHGQTLEDFADRVVQLKAGKVTDAESLAAAAQAPVAAAAHAD